MNWTVALSIVERLLNIDNQQRPWHKQHLCTTKNSETIEKLFHIFSD